MEALHVYAVVRQEVAALLERHVILVEVVEQRVVIHAVTGDAFLQPHQEALGAHEAAWNLLLRQKPLLDLFDDVPDAPVRFGATTSDAEAAAHDAQVDREQRALQLLPELAALVTKGFRRNLLEVRGVPHGLYQAQFVEHLQATGVLRECVIEAAGNHFILLTSGANKSVSCASRVALAENR